VAAGAIIKATYKQQAPTHQKSARQQWTEGKRS